MELIKLNKYYLWQTRSEERDVIIMFKQKRGHNYLYDVLIDSGRDICNKNLWREKNDIEEWFKNNHLRMITKKEFLLRLMVHELNNKH